MNAASKSGEEPVAQSTTEPTTVCTDQSNERQADTTTAAAPVPDAEQPQEPSRAATPSSSETSAIDANFTSLEAKKEEGEGNSNTNQEKNKQLLLDRQAEEEKKQTSNANSGEANRAINQNTSSKVPPKLLKGESLLAKQDMML